MTLYQRTIWISNTHAGNNADYLQKLFSNPHRDYPYLIVKGLDLGQIKIGLTFPLTSDERVQRVIDKAQGIVSANTGSGNDDQFSKTSEQTKSDAEESDWLFFVRQ